MTEGFFDHFFYWVFVTASVLTAIDWWIGPDGRAAAREKVGLWWLHVSESSFSGLVAEDAGRVERWLRGIFGQRWFGLRAILLCAALSLTISLVLLIIYWSLLFMQVDTSSEEGTIAIISTKALLGFEVGVEDIALDPEEVGIADPEELRRQKEMFLRDIEAVAARLRPILKSALLEVVLPLAILNALFDWISLGFSLLLLGIMARSVAAWRLTGLIVLDLTVACLLAALVLFCLALIVVGPGELVAAWSANFDEELMIIDRTIVVARQAAEQFDLWEGIFAFPALVLFTCALPTLIHLGVAVSFLSSKLFRPLLQPVLGRLLYLFHVSRQGVLTQLAVGGGIVAKATQESIKYFGA